MTLLSGICLVVGIIAGAAGCYWYDFPRRRIAAQEAEELKKMRPHYQTLLAEHARLSEQVSSLEMIRREAEKAQAKIDATYKAQFAEVAAKILDEKTKGLESKNTEALRPLALQLENFVKKVHEMERITGEKQAQLEKGLEDVVKATGKIDQTAVSLTNAIKGESIVRGSWGEEALKHILESAGMKLGVDYFEQVSEEGKRVDVQIALPNDRWIVVDSKTIFNHYMQYYNETDPKQKAALLEAHVKDVKKTIRDLSAKKYYKKFESVGEKVQPDYTLMFVYPESALLAAVSQDNDILQEAWTNNIALVSATSLMSTLKMVSKLWDIDKQQEYMESWKEDIVKFLEKFNDFLVNFAKTENAVLNAAETIKIARGHIDGNKGAMLPVVQRLVDMYEVPISGNSESLLKRLDYEYNGRKRKNITTKKAKQHTISADTLPAENPSPEKLLPPQHVKDPEELLSNQTAAGPEPISGSLFDK